jgi:hypothetical protein
MWKRDLKTTVDSWKELIDQIEMIAVVDARELVSYQDKERFRINYHKSGDDPTKATELAKKVKNKVRGYTYLRLVAKQDVAAKGDLPLGCMHDKVYDWIKRSFVDPKKE